MTDYDSPATFRGQLRRGLTCSVVEKKVPAGDKVTDTPASGSTTVHGTTSIDVTDTFPPQPPDGGGDLPPTGASPWLTLGAAAALLALMAGLVLYTTARRRRD